MDALKMTDPVGKPKIDFDSLYLGEWKQTLIVEYRAKFHYGIVKLWGRETFFNDSCRLSPRIERVRRTLDQRVIIDSMDHRTRVDEAKKIWFHRSGSRITQWFTDIDYDRIVCDAKAAATAARDQHNSLPVFTLYLESEPTDTSWSGCKDSIAVLTTNRPSRAIAEMKSLDARCTPGKTRAVMIVDFGSYTEVATTVSELVHFCGRLDSPACIL